MNEPPLNRREVCKLLAGGAAALAAGPAALRAGKPRSETQPFAPRYVVATSMYGKHSLKEIIPHLHKTGSAWLDVWPKPWGAQREEMDAMGLDAFAALCKRHKVHLAMTSRYDLGPFRLADEIKAVAKLGGRRIITSSGGRAKGDLKAAVKAFVEKLAPLAQAAQDAGIVICPENHGGSLLSTPDSIRTFAELAKSPALGVTLAPYHLPQDPELIGKLIVDLGPKLGHLYAWQHGAGMSQLPGRGKMDFAPILAALKKIRYDGWVGIFMHPPQGQPMADTLDKIAQEIDASRKYLEECLRKAG